MRTINIFELVGSIIIRNEAGPALDEIDESLSQTETKLQKFGKKMDKAGENVTKFGKGVSTKVGVPIMALGGLALKAATDVAGATKTIQNGLGVTADEAQKLTDVANDIYKKGFGESLEEVSQALVNVKQNMGDLVDDNNIDQVTTDAMALAQMLDTDVNEVTRAVSQTMKEFGTSSEEAFDLMAWGAQNGINFSGEMLDNVAEYSNLFADAGYSSEEYFKLLAAGAENGAYNLDYLNDVVKEFGIRIADDSKGTTEAMESMSGSTQDLFGEFKKGEASSADMMSAIIEDLGEMDDYTANLIGVQLFGTKWEDLGADAVMALGGIKGEIDDLDNSMGDVTKNLEESFGQRFQSLMRESLDALEPIGVILLDLAQKALPPLISNVQKAAEWFRDLSPQAQKMAVAIGGILVVAGPVIMIIGTLIGSIGKIIGAIKFAMPLFKAIGLVIGGISWPVLAVIAAIAGLIAVGYLLWKNWDVIKEKAIEIFGSIKEFIGNIFNNIMEIFNNALDWIDEKTNGKFKAITDTIRDYLNMAWEIIQTLWSYIKDSFRNALDFIKALVTGDFQGMKNSVSNQMENIRNTISSVWNSIKTFFTETLGNLVRQVGGKFTEMRNSVSEKSQEIVNKAKEKFAAIYSNVVDPMVRAKNKVGEMVDKIKGFFKNMKIKLPEIGLPKLPKPKLNPGGGMFGLPSVSWNAEGGIFDKPTIFNTSKGLQGVGEAGAEAIMPLNKLKSWIGDWVEEASMAGSAGDVSGAIDRVGEIIKSSTVNSKPQQLTPVEQVITFKIEGDWIVDSDERQKSVTDELSEEVKKYLRSRGDK